jgi:hypothetical protein
VEEIKGSDLDIVGKIVEGSVKKNAQENELALEIKKLESEAFEKLMAVKERMETRKMELEIKLKVTEKIVDGGKWIATTAGIVAGGYIYGNYLAKFSQESND